MIARLVLQQKNNIDLYFGTFAADRVLVRPRYRLKVSAVLTALYLKIEINYKKYFQ